MGWVEILTLFLCPRGGIAQGIQIRVKSNCTPTGLSYISRVQFELHGPPSPGGDVPSSSSSGVCGAVRVGDPEHDLVSGDLFLKITINLFGILNIITIFTM